jgi:hypothetical protein
MHKEWTKWMEAPDHDLALRGTMKQPAISLVCLWMKNSWRGSVKQKIVKPFKMCSISSDLDGTEDDAPFEESESPYSNISDSRFFVNLLGFPLFKKGTFPFFPYKTRTVGKKKRTSILHLHFAITAWMKTDKFLQAVTTT